MLTVLAQVSAVAQGRLLIHAGGDHDFPPYEFLQDGKPTGFNIDLMYALAEAMNFDVEIHLGPWKQVMGDLREKRLDVLTGMAYSEERSDDFDFSIPHTMILPALFVRQDSNIQTLTDVADKEIIVQQSDIMHEFLKKESLTSRIIPVTDHSEALRLFASGKHDGVLFASEIHKYHIANEFGYDNLRAVKANLMPQRYCMAVADGNRDLISLLDRGLILLKSNGTYVELYNKWFGSYEKHQWWQTIRYYIYGLVVVSAGLGLIVLWSWTLRSRVKTQTAALLANDAELKKAQSELEKRVRERTEDLATTNEMLSREVVERRKVEKALQKSEAEYRAIVDGFDGQIYICSADHRIEFMNAQLIKRTGRDATGQLCYRALHNREEVCPWCVNERVLAGESVRWEVQSPKDNRWYYIVNTPISRDKEIVAKQAVIMDVTDRVEAEEEMKNLEEKNRKLKKAESLGRMAAAIAHHFNNKLHVVIGCLEVIQLSCSAVQNPGERSLVSARQAAEQAAEVSRLMLTYLGQIPGRRESLDLSEVGKLYLSRTRDFLPRNITLKTHFAEPGPAIKANAGQLQVLLSHLVTNAMEVIGSEPGIITVNVGTVSQGDIATANVFPLHWRPTEEQYGCLEIGDDGSGMATENIEVAFDPFYSTKFTGRGMGLSVVQGIAQAHGGAIAVESTPGKGSVFRFFCPVVEERIAVKAPEVAAEAEKLWSGTVLLVDDDRIVLEITKAMLTKLGFSVLSAIDGKEAIELFHQRSSEICLILSDFAMPNMNGMQLLQAVRRIDGEIPIVLASGYSEEEVVNGQFRGDYAVFLEKPFGIVDLRKAVQISLPDDG